MAEKFTCLGGDFNASLQAAMSVCFVKESQQSSDKTKHIFQSNLLVNCQPGKMSAAHQVFKAQEGDAYLSTKSQCVTKMMNICRAAADMTDIHIANSIIGPDM